MERDPTAHLSRPRFRRLCRCASASASDTVSLRCSADAPRSGCCRLTPAAMCMAGSGVGDGCGVGPFRSVSTASNLAATQEHHCSFRFALLTVLQLVCLGPQSNAIHTKVAENVSAQPLCSDNGCRARGWLACADQDRLTNVWEACVLLCADIYGTGKKQGEKSIGAPDNALEQGLSLIGSGCQLLVRKVEGAPHLPRNPQTLTRWKNVQSHMTRCNPQPC